MKQLYQNSNTLRALAYFFDEPYAEAHLRKIARKARMSPATLSRCLALLDKDGFVLRREEKNATHFRANMTPEFKAQKIAYTVGRIVGAGIIDAVKEKSTGLGSFLLYGSAARGEDGPGSDYDFLLIAGSSEANGMELGEALGRETSLKVFSIGEWKKASRKNRAFYLEVITNSIALVGEKPVID